VRGLITYAAVFHTLAIIMILSFLVPTAITYAAVFHTLAIIMILSFLVATAMILRRTNHSPLWCLLWLFPPAGVVGLWVLAFKPWPSDKK